MIKFIRGFFYFNHNGHLNLQMNNTMSYNGTLIVLCCLTCRFVFVTCRFVFVKCRLIFVSGRLVFVTSRLVFVTCRLVFLTRRVPKCSYIKFSESFIFVSPSETPTGILPPQSIHLCYMEYPHPQG